MRAGRQRGLSLALIVALCASLPARVGAAPSPVLLESGSRLESFDARIEYSERAAVFR